MQQTLSAAALEFLAERHLATLTTLRADGSPHVVPVGFTWDADRGVARVITFASAVKAANADTTNADTTNADGGTDAKTSGVGRAAVCQVDGARWLTFEGPVTVRRDPGSVAAAVAAYADRYRQPKVRDDRVVIEIDVDRVLSNRGLREGVPT